MTHEQVDKMLADYKACIARVGHLEQLIPRWKRDLEKWEHDLVKDEALSTPDREEGMPHGTTVGNPVESIVLKYADGFLPPELIEEKKKLMEAEKELEERKQVILFVEAWMKGLSEREAWVVNHKVLEVDYSWRDVISLFKRDFGDWYSKDYLRSIKDRALNKIYAAAM